MLSTQVANAFALAAHTYDGHADVQRLAAEKLAGFVEANTRDLIDGTILEIGCGTGLFSRRLVDLFLGRRFHLTDLSPEMLERCRIRLGIRDNVQYKVQDFSACPDEQSAYAMVAAAFSLQWVTDLQTCLENLTQQLVPGGKLFFSVPAAGSFAEWRSLCIRAGVPFSANSLPASSDFREFAERKQLRLSVYEETIRIGYPSFYAFLDNLKLLGANTSLRDQQLSVSELRRLIRVSESTHPQRFMNTYHVLFGSLTRAR